MDYYVNGDPARAEEIKAAFEKLGVTSNADRYNYKNDNVLYFTAGGMIHMIDANSSWANIIKTHPDYKELELPVEPKFKVGDWYLCTKDFYGKGVRFDKGNAYYCGREGCLCQYEEGANISIVSQLYDYFKLWSIVDAKDGDVLATNSIICIFKKLDKDGYYIISPCVYTVKDGLEIISDENDTIGSYGFKPATKEDRELLFRKMKEVGYEWDEKKKELRKIQPHYDIKNFQPFDKVLVRDHNADAWEVGWYGRYKEDTRHFVGTRWSRQCIPFEGNEHLLGTTDMPDEMYINW